MVIPKFSAAPTNRLNHRDRGGFFVQFADELADWQQGGDQYCPACLHRKVLLKSAKIGEPTEFIPVGCLIQFEEAFNLAGFIHQQCPAKTQNFILEFF